MPYSDELDVRITDSSLRDGSHAKSHQFSVETVQKICSALDHAGVPVIEVSHGDGLGGSSFNYGFSGVNERELIKAAVGSVEHGRIASLLLPGVGTMEDIRPVTDLGVSIIRVATHSPRRTSRSSTSTRSGARSRDRRLPHDVALGRPGDPRQAGPHHGRRGGAVRLRLDSAGALILDQVTDRIEALVSELGSEVMVGFTVTRTSRSAWRTPSPRSAPARCRWTVAPVPSAQERATRRPKSSSRSVTAWGSAPVSTPSRSSTSPRRSSAPKWRGECVLDRLSIIMGYAGVYSSFLRHAYRAAERYHVSGAEILRRCGERKLVGGQEDQIIEIAVGLMAELPEG